MVRIGSYKVLPQGGVGGRFGVSLSDNSSDIDEIQSKIRYSLDFHFGLLDREISVVW